MCKKIIAVLLALMMIAGCCSAAAETVKHERVYVVTDAEGTVKSLTDSIRLENADGLDELTDRTLLTAIENVGGKESFSIDGEVLTWQADGKDIVYQGTSDQKPAVLPTVTLTLDGKPVTAEELKNGVGEAVMTVSWTAGAQTPVLAVSVMPLPAEGISGIVCENSTVLSEMGIQILAGWAVPGMDAVLNLPDHFSVSFHADHANLGWMMTLCTADPIDLACREINSRVTPELQADLQAAVSVLTALKDGKKLPEVQGRGSEIVKKISTLNNGLNTLDSGALLLGAGAANVSKGASALSAGLSELAQNNETLNAGAAQILDAVLSSANSQLAACGLDQMGLTLPELTAENYAEVLDSLIAQLQGAALKTAREKLTALKAQLDQVTAFTAGLKSYTEGVSSAAAGAATLSAGAATLQTGVTTLQTTGTAELKKQILDAEKNAAAKFLPYLETGITDALRIFTEAESGVQRAGYDLRPETMKTVTVYIIRTDLQ